MENENLREQMAEILNGFTEEQKEKAKACKTPEELMAFLGKLGAALPDELLDAVAGGADLRGVPEKPLDPNTASYQGPDISQFLNFRPIR